MDDGLAFKSAPGRWVIAVVVLGSGMAFLDRTVVYVTLPRSDATSMLPTSVLQWIVNGYLPALSSLILLGWLARRLLARESEAMSVTPRGAPARLSVRPSEKRIGPSI